MPEDQDTRDRYRELYKAIGAEIRHARASRSADSLGRSIGKDQTSISNYERGQGRVALDVLWAIEDELGLGRGRLIAEAGAIEPELVPVNTTAEQAIMDDPDIEEQAKIALLYVYRYSVRVARERAGEAEPSLAEKSLRIRDQRYVMSKERAEAAKTRNAPPEQRDRAG